MNDTYEELLTKHETAEATESYRELAEDEVVTDDEFCQLVELMTEAALAEVATIKHTIEHRLCADGEVQTLKSVIRHLRLINEEYN
tara:strand:- start:699 stop:956 length:258 start_codon:yes stop_codon:yes gene_type:complete